MPVGEIHVNDVGTNFVVTIKNEDNEAVDVSTASIKNLIFRKPDGTLLTKASSFVTDGTDGQIKYSFISGDLDQHGKWSVQAFIDFGSTEWYSDIDKFTVYNNLGC
jgi:hypothetical protein